MFDKMKPLGIIYRCLIWVCIHPADESLNKWQKITCAIFAVFILAIQTLVLVASSVFCWKFFSIDLEKCMFAFMIVAGAFGSIYMMIVAITMMRSKIDTFFNDLSTIYNASKCPMLLHIEHKMNVY